MKNFYEQVASLQRAYTTVLCLGLDPRPHYLTAEDRTADNPLAAWGERMIRETADYLCCVKPNIAFYEAQGSYGWEALKKTITTAHTIGLPVLLDAKRGDIGSTAEAYAVAAFRELEADAITLNPYLGRDAIDPFLKVEGRGIFVICHTSNPSTDEFQTLEVNGRPLYEVVAMRATQWSEQVGLVVGATFPHAIAAVRALAPDAWLLLPGVGAQGADERAALTAARHNVIVPVSRALLEADNPREAAKLLRDKFNRARDRGNTPPPATLTLLQQQLTDALLAIGAVKFGDFTLASGAQSPIYVDLRLLASHPRTLNLAARAYAEILTNGQLQYDLIAALPYAALPIGTAVSLQTGDPLIYPRKEAKAYGTKKNIEGKWFAGQTVVVLDDLVSTGGTKVKGAEPLREAGLVVEDIVVLIDRSGGTAAQELAAHGLRLHSVISLEAMMHYLVQRGAVSSDKASEVTAYLEAQSTNA